MNMRLRPHHLADIFKAYGNNRDLFTPHPYGHAQHEIAEKVLNDPDTVVEFVLENDDICKPCRHLNPDNSCSDVLSQCSPVMPKQVYNDGLDLNIFKELDMKPGTCMSAVEFLKLLMTKAPKIFSLLTHPGSEEENTSSGLTKAVEKYCP
jgi:hypothetical protein